MTTSKLVFPLSDASRELIMDVCKFLYFDSWVRAPHNDRLNDAIAELLNYLPEVQFHGEQLQEVMIEGHLFQFARKQPQRPLMDAICQASDFESNECEITCMIARFEEVAS
jgi:hypothetical protein